ncbi:MAG: DUF6516 family protein [Candidatus Nanohalobium sp.]
MISSIWRKLDSLGYIVEEQDISFERIDEETFRIDGKIVFANGYSLEFMEYSSPENHDYRFHLMDESDNLVKRWDNAPHHEELENFPFHVHVSEDKIEPDKQRELVSVLDEIEKIIVENL